MRYLLLLAVVSCGSPFSARIPGEETDSGAPEAADDSQAGQAESSTDTSTPDSSAASDAPAPDGPAVELDAGPPPPPSDAGCSPFGTATVLCPGSAVGSTTPVNYCVYDSTSGTSTLATTPSACQCKAAYDCACLEASVTVPSQLCAITQIYAGCSVVDGAPLVTCEDP